MYNRSTDLQID